MPSDRSPRARLPRRGFLGALALAPAALGACRTASAAAGASGGPAAPGSAPAPAPDAAVRAVREAPLAADAEPAFVFRAGAARPGEP
jgi:hypothetical protein